MASAPTTPYPGADEVGYELFGLKAYFDGDRKILQMPPPFGNGSWQLYDLEADPAELNDLAGSEAERLSDMISLWEAYKEANGVLDISIDLSTMVN